MNVTLNEDDEVGDEGGDPPCAASTSMTKEQEDQIRDDIARLGSLRAAMEAALAREQLARERATETQESTPGASDSGSSSGHSSLTQDDAFSDEDPQLGRHRWQR